MEVLIADDGSADNSITILERYQSRDNRIRWWKNERNLGLVGNFNACLRAARGDYVKYVLQDDVLWSPQAMRKMVGVLDANADVSLVGTASYILNEQSRVTELRDHFKAGVMEGKRVILRCLEQPRNLIGEPSVVMFRRKQAEAGYHEQFRQLLDLDLWFQLLEQGNFHYLAEPLCSFREHQAQQSVVNRREGKSNEEVLLLDRWYDKPWLQERITRRLLFAQSHALRRQRSSQAQAWRQKLAQRLGKSWYSIYWARRKVLRPFGKLARKLRALPYSRRVQHSPYSQP